MAQRNPSSAQNLLPHALALPPANVRAGRRHGGRWTLSHGHRCLDPFAPFGPAPERRDAPVDTWQACCHATFHALWSNR